MDFGLTDLYDTSSLATVLSNLEPGHLPKALFEAVARLVVTPTFVVIPLFRRNNCTRVFLTRRDDDDTHYAGLLHPPGKIMLASDENLEAVFKRLVSSELGILKSVSSPIFVAPFFEQIMRGQEISLVHYSTVADPGDKVATFDCSALPVDVISTDVPRIKAAVEAFEQPGEP